MKVFRKLILITVLVSIFLFYGYKTALATPTIGSISEPSGDPIQLFHKFEIAFIVSNTTATNFLFPYDANPPSGITPGLGINVEVSYKKVSQTWPEAKKTPCFYYQPMKEITASGEKAFIPDGAADWRCRFVLPESGDWQYKVVATDSGGSSESAVGSLTTSDCATNDPSDWRCQGFVKVSPTDNRFFEFSASNKPFVTPLVNFENGGNGIINTLSGIRSAIPQLGTNGVRFLRWFPTGEGTNMFVAPYGDDMRWNWGFGNSWTTTNGVDTERGKRFSFSPDSEGAVQRILTEPGHYRFSFWAKMNSGTLTPQVNTDWFGNQNLISGTVTSTSWNYYSYEVDLTSGTPIVFVGFKLNGSARTHSLMFQRWESARSTWSGNILSRADPDTYNYVDQPASAKLDEILKLSEHEGVFHKLTVFHKNDHVLNLFQADGSIGNWYQCDWGQCPNNFYAANGRAARWYEDAYTRYFVGRWSYSTAIHSLELANECDLYAESYDAGWHLAELVKQLSSRYPLMTNSFWGYWADTFFNDPVKGSLLDYSDKHWYSNTSGSDCQAWGCEVISNLWNDSVGYVRECQKRFDVYRSGYNYSKPIVRGEGGTAVSGTDPQYCEIAKKDSGGVYYHKKVWSQLGALGDTCDGEWYPWLYLVRPTDDPQCLPGTPAVFPNDNNNLFKFFKNYEAFLNGEALNNGLFTEIGTDLTGNEQVVSSNNNLRAFGVRDYTNGRVLLWADNSADTWWNHVSNVTINPVSGTLTIKGLQNGTYTVQRWNTRSGTMIDSNNQTASNNQLILTISSLSTDVAYKLIGQGMQTTPTPAPPTATPTQSCTANVDGQNGINISDFRLVLANWGKTSGYGNADINSDGKVNGLDLVRVIKEWGRNCL